MGRGNSGLFHNTFGTNKAVNSAVENKTNNTQLNNSLIDANLIQELKDKNIKFTEQDMLFITKDKTGQTVWLEKGNESAGFEHIQKRHLQDFMDKHNITAENLATHIYSIFTQGNLAYSRIITSHDKDGYERLYKYNGQYYLLSGVGTNGFIVSAYPIDEKDAVEHMRRYNK